MSHAQLPKRRAGSLVAVGAAVALAGPRQRRPCSPARSPATARLKEVHGRSFCAFSGQEDLQWFTDDVRHGPRCEDPVRGEPGARAVRGARSTRRPACS